MRNICNSSVSLGCSLKHRLRRCPLSAGLPPALGSEKEEEEEEKEEEEEEGEKEEEEGVWAGVRQQVA